MRRTLLASFWMFLLVGLSVSGQEPASYLPMPIPQWEPATGNDLSNPFLIRHCMMTNQNDSTAFIDRAFPNQAFSEPFNPGIPVVDEPFPGMKNFTDLSLISDPTPYPWCTTVKLFMTFPNSAQFVGSGAMISPGYVITAGHCVYSQDNGGWATSITVVPAYNSGNYPFGSANASYLYSWTGWTTSHDYDWDMGYIDLDSDIGNTVGWLGFGYNNDDNFYYSNTFHNPGYPAESPYNGSQMYYWYGDYDDVQTHRLYFTKYCYGGQSGSGSYYKDGSDNRYVYAVLSHQLGTETGHIRITSDKFNSMYNRIYGVEEKEKTQGSSLRVFPNPSAGSFCIQGLENKGILIIQNVLGEIVFERSLAEKDEQINLSHLPDGLYTVIFQSDDHQRQTTYLVLAH